MKIAAAAASINAHSYGSGIICPSQSNYSPEVQLRLVVAAAAAVLGVALLGRRDLRLVVRDVIFCRLGITAVVAESGEHDRGGRGGKRPVYKYVGQQGHGITKTKNNLRPRARYSQV